MEDPTTQGESNSQSASEKGISDGDQKKRGSGSTTSFKPNQNQEDSTTPTANPPQGSQQQFTMAPPPRPNFKATPTSAQPSKSMSQASSQEASQELPAASSQTIGNGDHQPAASSEHHANDRTNATPRKRSHVEVDQEPTVHDQESSDDDAEPADQIAPFDWVGLEQRYHHQMGQYATEEQELYRSFNELCGYFYVWAEAGHAHEVDRSFKRMKTQITLVQHNEEALESKRLHYVKVVEAFKSALQLLGGD
ncbi:hypothetical protein MBLNU13_g06107t2 [Cladosporium sp. NU13]